MSDHELLMDALDYVDDAYLKQYFEMKERCEKKGSAVADARARVLHFFGSSKRIASVAAVFAMLICGLCIIFSMMSLNPENVDTFPVTTDSFPPPQYIPAHETPTLEEVYRMEPFSELLPQKLLLNCSFKKSYLTKYDPFSNPDDRKFLDLHFDIGEADLDYMSLTISEHDAMTARFADPDDPNTYRLDLYYGPKENGGALDSTLPDVFRVFRAEDVTPEIVAARIYTYQNGMCKASIKILCGDYEVSYWYTGPEITAEEFYEMLMSSNWFS